MINYRTCYWSFSKQCKVKSCKNCFLYYPTIKGEIDQPDFEKYTHKQIDEGIETAFKDKKIPKLKKFKASKRAGFLDKHIRDLIIEQLTKIKGPSGAMGIVLNMWRNRHTHGR